MAGRGSCTNPVWNSSMNKSLTNIHCMPCQKEDSGRGDPLTWGKENQYNNRVLVGNWFDERRMYHQLCSRCTGHSIYRTEFLPHCKEDYMGNGCLPPRKYHYITMADGEGWKLLRNTEDYCEYLSNYTTTYDLMHNWEVRRANCKGKPRRKWKPIRDNLWVPEQDNSLSYGNLTQYGFRKAPVLPPVPNDWKTYDMSTEYTNRFHRHKYPEAYTTSRFATPKPVVEEMEEYIRAKKSEDFNSPFKRSEPRANNACCPQCFPKNPKRFDGTVFVSNLKSHPGKQTLIPARPVDYPQLKHPPQPYPFYSAPEFRETHSCVNDVACEIGQYAQDVAKCC